MCRPRRAVGHRAFASNPNREGGSDSTRHLPLGVVACISDASSFTRRVTNIVAVGVITNLPGVARDVLMQRNNMSSTDRLLTEIAALLGKPPTYEEQ